MIIWLNKIETIEFDPVLLGIGELNLLRWNDVSRNSVENYDIFSVLSITEAKKK